MKPLRRRRLVIRLALVGLVQLFGVVFAISLVGAVSGRRTPHRSSDRLLLEAVAFHLNEDLSQGRSLHAALDSLRQAYQLELSVYDRQGALLSSTATPALSPHRPSEGMMFPPPFLPWLGPPPPRRGVFRVGQRELLLVARRPMSPPPVFPLPLITLSCGLAVVGLGAFFTARWILRPLERLSAATDAIGRGDLSARVGARVPDEFGELNARFDEMAERIQGLVMSEKELMANVSHELKTPLARIRVALQLAHEEDAEMARAWLDEIAIDLAELECLVEDILTVTRIDLEGRQASLRGFRLQSSPVSAQQLASRAAARFRHLHAARPLLLSVQSDLPPIMADATLFRRALDNLLNNAHKYSPEADRPIECVVYERGDELVFEVRDHGVGIAEADLPRVFEPFFRAERSRSRSAGGVGLGLTLVQRIVEAHQGRAEIESSWGDGTTVRLYMPALPRELASA
jgi:two-component system OmpR family sensor kinase